MAVRSRNSAEKTAAPSGGPRGRHRAEAFRGGLRAARTRPGPSRLRRPERRASLFLPTSLPLMAHPDRSPNLLSALSAPHGGCWRQRGSGLLHQHVGFGVRIPPSARKQRQDKNGGVLATRLLPERPRLRSAPLLVRRIPAGRRVESVEKIRDPAASSSSRRSAEPAAARTKNGDGRRGPALSDVTGALKGRRAGSAACPRPLLAYVTAEASVPFP